jgi:hypothetical protein
VYKGISSGPRCIYLPFVSMALEDMQPLIDSSGKLSQELTLPSLCTQLRFILCMNLTFGGCTGRDSSSALRGYAMDLHAAMTATS